MPDEYKALTVIHLPYVEETYAPGSLIPRESFEAYAEQAAAANPDGEFPSNADAAIDELMKYGSLSDDPDAELHPDHRPVDPTKPTMTGLIEQAKSMVAELEANGAPVPDELRALSEHTHIVTEQAGGGME